MKRLAVTLCLVLLLGGCRIKEVTLTRNAFLLDTMVSVTLYGSEDQQALDAAIELCRQYDAMFSRTDPESWVYRLNHADGRWVDLPEDIAQVVETAVEYARLSDGRYDITICPVTDLWSFTSSDPVPPDQNAVKRELDRVGWEKIELDSGRIRLRDGAMIDLGSIAKGYIADRIAELLRDRDVMGATINLGGNVVTVGRKPGGEPYRIGIQAPFEQRNETIGTVAVGEKAVVSSGLYERSFRYEGKLYHHILDPATGYPAETDLTGVTVLADKGMDADALSTVIFLLGSEEGLALAESLEGVDALLITADGRTLLTNGFAITYDYQVD